MRIVCVADTHTYERSLASLPDGDVFVHAGDLLRSGTLEELMLVARWIRSLPYRHKLVVAGNHDWCFLRCREDAIRALGEDVHYLEDSGTVVDGLRFWGSPWQPEFHSWAFNLPRGQALRDKWALIPADTDILVTHGPPVGFGDRLPSGNVGCKELLGARQRVRPILHMFGHIHEDGGAWQVGKSWLSNVTTWECMRGPTVFDIDSCTKDVIPVKVPRSDRFVKSRS